MNHLTIIGNLTGDPVSRTTQSGKTVCTFTVAVNRRRKGDGQQEADFFRVSAWGQTGENCQKYLTKGRKVCVSGPVSCSAFAKQDGTPGASLDVFANEIEFLSPKENGDSGTPAGFTAVDDDGLPWGR